MTDHVLIITERTEDGDTERDYAIECPGVTDKCRMWFPCNVDGCPPNGDQDYFWEADDDPDAHGVEHRYIGGEWMTPTDRCYLAGHDSLSEAAEWLRLQPGRYPVGWDCGDGTELELIVKENVGG